jgi:hypothetical protein
LATYTGWEIPVLEVGEGSLAVFGGRPDGLTGLIHFLEANYSFHRFERKNTCGLKPGPKPNRLPTQRNLGHTGTALAEQIREVLRFPAVLTTDVIDSYH